MRTSHQKIHKLIAQTKSTITDEELFTSKAYRGYLEDIAEVVSKRYKRPIKVVVEYDPKNQELAMTDNQTIIINAGNDITMSLGNRTVKSNQIIGMLGHELGHVNFTNFYLAEVFISSLKNGMFYPNKPKPETSEEEAALFEIEEIFKSKDQIAEGVIIFVLQSLNNILEDAFVEAKMACEFPGKLKKCIIMQRALLIDNTPSIIEQIDKKYDNLAIIINLILSYATASKINNDGGYKGEFLDKLKECITYIDTAICCDDIKIRFKSSLQLLLKIWKYVKEAIDKEKKNQDKKSKQNSKATKNKKKQSGVEKALNKQIKGNTTTPNGKTMPVNNPNSQKQSGDSTSMMQDIRDEIQKAVEEELGRLPLENTPISNKDGSGKIDKNNNYTGNGYDSSASDIERVLNKVATEKVYSTEEEKLAVEMKDEVSQICYGDIHRGIDIVINRINPIPEVLKNEYVKVAAPLVYLSKKLQKGIQNVIKDRKLGGKLTGLYMGKRIESRSFSKNDGKYFYKRILPDEELDIAVSVLVDESGSMSSCDRITVARATSLILYDFCQKLKIPISIVGHNVRYGIVNLYSYADYDSIDGNDKYRIMDMTSRGCNRDGAALRYVAEQLIKRSEKVKLLIIISDGQPSDTGYGGLEAEEDLRQIKSEYTKKGITLFAAAIGEDKDTIERIYKDGFLDITDLTKLPANLIKLITRYIK